MVVEESDREPDDAGPEFTTVGFGEWKTGKSFYAASMGWAHPDNYLLCEGVRKAMRDGTIMRGPPVYYFNTEKKGLRHLQRARIHVKMVRKGRDKPVDMMVPIFKAMFVNPANGKWEKSFHITNAHKYAPPDKQKWTAFQVKSVIDLFNSWIIDLQDPKLMKLGGSIVVDSYSDFYRMLEDLYAYQRTTDGKQPGMSRWRDVRAAFERSFATLEDLPYHKYYTAHVQPNYESNDHGFDVVGERPRGHKEFGHMAELVLRFSKTQTGNNVKRYAYSIGDSWMPEFANLPVKLENPTFVKLLNELYVRRLDTEV